MKIVYSHENYALVGYAKNRLEDAGIEVTEKNQYTTAGMAPPFNIAAELWVLNDADYERAMSLLKDMAENDGER